MKLLRAIIAATVAVLTAVASYHLLFLALGPVNTWYSRRFVEPSELEPLYPPLMWMDFTVLPLLASALGGLLSGMTSGDKNRGVPGFVGLSIVAAFFWFFRRAVTLEPILYAVGTVCGVLAVLTTYWTQKKSARSFIARNN